MFLLKYDNVRVNFNFLMTFSYAVVTTVAGSSVASFGDGTGSQAGFDANGLLGMAVDASGNVYVSGSQRVRKINPAGGAHAFLHECSSVVERSRSCLHTCTCGRFLTLDGEYHARVES
jgi:hypothetical protein